MSVNRYRKHLLILPEDDANRQLANGFMTYPALDLRAIQVLLPSGGWPKVHSDFIKIHIDQLRNNRLTHLVLLIDFDNQVEERTEHFKKEFADVAERVYLLGTLDEPEPLKVDLGRSFEKIGQELARDCVNDNYRSWQHPFLQHNRDELQRLINDVKPFLFI